MTIHEAQKTREDYFKQPLKQRDHRLLTKANAVILKHAKDNAEPLPYIDQDLMDKFSILYSATKLSGQCHLEDLRVTCPFCNYELGCHYLLVWNSNNRPAAGPTTIDKIIAKMQDKVVNIEGDYDYLINAITGRR